MHKMCPAPFLPLPCFALVALLAPACHPVGLVAGVAAATPVIPSMIQRRTRLGHFQGRVELPAELATVAERELGETVEVRERALSDLRLRLAKLEKEGVKTGCPIGFPRKDDQFLICFLRARKFRLDDAEELVVKYTQFVLDHADILTSLDPRDPYLDPAFLKEKLGAYFLPGTTRAGARMIGWKMGEHDRKIFHNLNAKEHQDDLYKAIIRHLIYLHTMLLSDPWYQVQGCFFLQDYEGAPTLAEIFKLDRLLSIRQKKNVFGLLQILPMRFKGIAYMHQPLWYTLILKIVKPFMSKKLRDRILVLGNDESKQLHALVDPAQLPEELSGEMDYAPYQRMLGENHTEWKLHACGWEELGISASHVKTGVDEHAPPPYAGSEKIRGLVASRRRSSGEGDAGPGAMCEEALELKTEEAQLTVGRNGEQK